MQMVYIETERLILRSWTPDDLPAFAAMNSDERVMRYFPATLSYDQTCDFYNRIVREFDEKGYGLYAVELKSTGEFIGYVGLHEIGFKADFTPGVEIGWRLAADFHNKGYATEAAKAVCECTSTLVHRRLYSFTAVINKPSERVMQKIGMVKVGEFGHPNVPPHSPLHMHVLYRIDL